VMLLKEGTLTVSRPAIRPAIIRALRDNVPLLVSLIPLIPFFVFFNTFEINRKLLAMNVQVQPYAHYLGNLSTVADYLIRFEPVWLLVFLKALQFVFSKSILRIHSSPAFKVRLLASVFLTLLGIAIVFFATRVPNFPFTRYFLPAIPLIALLIALDFMILWKTLAEISMLPRKATQLFFSVVCLGLYGVVLPHNASYIKGHVYEMIHPYRGHLDYMIPWIQENYPDRNQLIIAANYEESSFMYYTGARVTVGYVKANLARDTNVQPDIIYFNELWMWGEDQRLLDGYFAKSGYRKVYFPVAKYRVNNIPEVHHQPEITHQFSTLVPSGQDDMASLWVKEKR
jgi:hypothetical protein